MGKSMRAGRGLLGGCAQDLLGRAKHGIAAVGPFLDHGDGDGYAQRWRHALGLGVTIEP